MIWVLHHNIDTAVHLPFGTSPEIIITSKGRSEETSGRDVAKECNLSINEPLGITDRVGTEKGWVD